MLAVSVPFKSGAEDLDSIFKRVDEFMTAKKYPKALEELAWARKEIEKQHNQQLQAYFPETLLDYKGDKINSNGALGFLSVDREYKKGESTLKVSLSGTSGGDAAGGLGGLAAFGKMAALMQNQAPGNETVRVAGKTATLNINTDSKSGDMSIFLDSGAILRIEMPDNASADTIKKAADALQIEALDKYLLGQ